MKHKILLTVIIASLLILSACNSQTQNPPIQTILSNCPIRPSNNPIGDLDEGFVEVLFMVEASDPEDTIVIWQGNTKIFECNNLLPDEITGEGLAFRKAVRVEGETFRFELAEDPDNNHEAYLVPVPIVYPENPETTVYLATFRHHPGVGWQTLMHTEPVYYE